jgi:hypothetical protein
MDLQDRVALVTGASRGIGRELALDLAAAGCAVAALARSADQLECLAGEIGARGGRCLAQACDVTDAAAVARAVSLVEERLGAIDVAISNAGIGTFRSPVEASLAEMRVVMEVNFWGGVNVVKAVLPAMAARRSGRIVFVGSVGGKHGFPRQAAYSASKFALVGFAESLALDLEVIGVGVTVVNPGPVATSFFQDEALAGLRGVSSRMAVPASAVSKAVLRAIRREQAEITVPRRLVLPGIARAVVPGLFRRGLRAFARRNGLLWEPAPAAPGMRRVA